MTKIRIKKLVWDAWNTEHIKKHNVSIQEVEFAGKYFLAHKKAKQGRYSIISRVNTRIITVVVRRVESAVYYVVTARDADKPERKKVYEKESK